MANEFIIKNGYFSQGSSTITGSLTVTAGVTASLQGTASWSNNAITASYIVTAQTASYVLNAVSSSFATTAQNANTASFVTTAQTASYVLNAVSSSFSSTAQNANTASFVTLAQTASFVTTAQTASYVLNAVSASRATSASRADSAVTASYVLNAVSASFASTASFVNTLNQNVTVSGSLTVTNDFTVLGSASILFITSSQLNIADNIISVNTIQPGVRFGGLAVIDSGSTPQVSGSMLFDSQNNQWIFVHQSAAGAAVTSSTVLMGPQTFNNVGSETQLTTNRIPKAAGVDLGEHLNDSNITDTGVLVSINSATQITGSLTLGGGATGSLQGTASWAASASNVAPTSNAFVQGGNSFGTTATLGTNDNQNLNFETNGSVRMSISSSGQVVHGSNPLLILSGGLFEGVSPFMEVQTGVTGGAYNEAVVLRHNGISAAAVTRSLGLLIKLSNEGLGAEAPKMGGMILRSTSTFANSPDLHFVIGNTERMTISNAGNVGIGTTTPNAKLQVVGNITATSVTASLQGTSSFATSASNALTASFVNPLQQEVLITGSLIVSASGGTNDFRVGTNKLFVSASGNVGIGTTLPTSSLHVVGPTAGETITADNNDFGTIIRSRNTSGTGTPRQFYVTHNLGDVDLGNLRGNINITTGSVGINTNATQTAFAKFVVRAATNNLFGFASVSSTASIIAWDDTGASNTLRLAGNPLIFTGAGGAGAEHMRLNSSGELGIGQSPTTGFRVAANGTIGSFAPAGSPTGSIYIDHTGVQSWKIGVSASSTSTLSIGNDLGGAFVNKILNLTNAGNVGIGTTTPTQGTLQVNGNVFATSFTGSITGSVTGALTGTASFATSASFLTSNTNAFIQGGNSFGTTATLGTNDAQGLNIETAGATRISVSGSGEVGIGLSANANGQLFVLTSTKTYGIAANNTSNNGTGIIGQVGPSGGTGTVIGVHGLSNSSVATNNIGLFGQALNGTNNYAIRLQDGSEGIGKVLVAQTANGDGKWGTQLTGNYEITGSLIVSASGTTNDLRVGTNKLFVSASSNVGIGTAAPNARLHVSGGAETIRIETSASIGSGPYMTFYGNNTMRGYIGYGASTTNQLLLMNQASGTNASLNLGTNSLIRLTVSSSGEVGIGTSYTSPSSLLSVLAPFESNAFDITNAAETPFKYRIINSGSAISPGLSFKSGLYYNNLENATVNFWRGASTTGGFLTFNTNNGTERMRIDANGNVGIGNTNPPNTLSVSNAGATAVTATTYALAVQRSNVTDITLGSDASFSYLQSWQSKPLLLNSLGNNIGINKTTTPNAVLDVNGNTIITGSLSVTSVGNNTGSFVTINGNKTLNSRTAAQVRVDINYYGLTYAMQNGYY